MQSVKEKEWVNKLDKDRKYTLTDHSTGEKYDITEHKSEPDTILDPNGYPIYTKNTAIPISEAAKLHEQTKEKSTDELIAEARKYFPRQEPKPEPKPQTKFDKEIERSTKEWEQYFNQHPNKIRYNIFNEIERALDY
jgi:hypothetical protein